jgi:hypothetical protein
LERSRRTPEQEVRSEVLALICNRLTPEQVSPAALAWREEERRQRRALPDDPVEDRLKEERRKVEVYEAEQAKVRGSLPCGLVELPPKQEPVQADGQPATCALLALIR